MRRSLVSVLVLLTTLLGAPVATAAPGHSITYESISGVGGTTLKAFVIEPTGQGSGPFPLLGGRENCTVGALRATAVDHDVSIRSTNATKVGSHATKAVDLAPKDEQKDLKAELDNYKSQAAAQQIQQAVPTPTPTVG